MNLLIPNANIVLVVEKSSNQKRCRILANLMIQF